MNAPALQSRPAKSKPGCLFYGCLTVVILGLLISAGIGFGVWLTVKKLNEAVDQYTTTTPTTLPQVEMSDEDYSKVQTRLNQFGQALEGGGAVEKLTLTADEVNALLAKSEAVAQWGGQVFVRMESNEITGDVSLPLDRLAEGPFMSRLRGRYLNGTARFGVEMQNGRLFVRLLGMKVNDQVLPAEVLKGFATVNLADGVYENPEAAQALAKIGRIQVEEGKLLVTPAGTGTQ